MKNINELKSTADQFNGDSLRKDFPVDDYMGHVEKRGDVYWSLEDDCEICSTDCVIRSTIYLVDGEISHASYCIVDGNNEKSENDDDLDGVVELWKSTIQSPAASLGSMTSEKKAASSRENGKKGGRPSSIDKEQFVQASYDLTVSELARLFKVTPQTIHRYGKKFGIILMKDLS